jgi:cellulose synthase (UDP-forming)
MFANLFQRLILIILLVNFTSASAAVIDKSVQPMQTTSGTTERSQKAKLQERPDSKFTYYFDRDLQVEENMYLWGVRGSREIHFQFPRSWRQLPGTSLILNIAHSPALLPKLSYITVELNGRFLKTIKLDGSNVDLTAVSISLGNLLLKEDNVISFRHGQHYTLECEDPFSSALWSVIGNDSRIAFKAIAPPPVLDLQNWPYPIVDESSREKSKIFFSLPAHPSNETLRAAAILSSNLGTVSNASVTEIVDAQSKADKVIFVGTPDENSQMQALLSDAHLTYSSGKMNSQSGLVIGDNSGILSLSRGPSESSLALLVTGNKPSGVLKAANALVNKDLNPAVNGTISIINEVISRPGRDGAVRTDTMPDKRTFPLSDLGFQTSTVRGIGPSYITVQANTLPGIKLLGTQPILRLSYGYSAQPNTDLSTMEVTWNGISVASFALIKQGGETKRTDDIIIPAQLLKANNQIDIIFHLMPKHLERCVPLTDQHLWGTVYADSILDIDREYINMVPDLSLLQYDGFPFVRDRNLSNLAFVVPSDASSDTTTALMQFSNQIGKWGAFPNAPVQVVFDNMVSEKMRSSSNLIVFSSRKAGNSLERVLPELLRLNANDQSKHLTTGLSMLHNADFSTSGILQEMVSPWHDTNTVLLVSGSTPETFQLGKQGVLEKRLREKLSGTVATISSNKIVKLVANGLNQRTITTALPWRFTAFQLSNNPWLAPILVLILIVIAAFAVRWMLNRKQRENIS